ncbi:M20/M25/M40 family metallo-hydrolase [Trichococcus pasteurii]|nr:M20/M25/M40 family metallo-hydrolase [Trichococcus pasteurii]
MSALLVEQGFIFSQVDSRTLDFSNESELNVEFLKKILNESNCCHEWQGSLLIVEDTLWNESEWLALCAVPGRGRTEMCGYFDEEDNVSLAMLDLYISGLVRQLNRLGCMTIMSCDGEGERRPNIVFATENDTERAALLMVEVELKHRVKLARKTIVILKERKELLSFVSLLNELPENLSAISTEHLERTMFENVVEELLEIPGVSGYESIIRNHVMKKLATLTDKMTVDDYGNILAEVTFGRACREPSLTILLNSHLDVVDEIEAGREILKCGPVWTSSSGILGADDRAGVGVILHTLKQLQQMEFRAPVKVKIAFTVEEEVGLCGAKSVSSEFLEDIHAALVVDRRGRGDVVTGTRGIDFCDELFGEMLALIGNLGDDENRWEPTLGGSSDTRIWAQQGIQSVNLSVGYQYEHTSREELNLDDAFATANLLKKVFLHLDLLKSALSGIRRATPNTDERLRRNGRKSVSAAS